MQIPDLGLGIGWRPELALAIERCHARFGFVEVIAENVDRALLPAPLRNLRRLGLQVVPHGISLSLGSAEGIDLQRVRRLGELAAALKSPIVSEHVAFVRAGDFEAGHLLPLPRTRTALQVLVENIRAAKDLLPVPLALENVSALLHWPDTDQMDEADFLGELLECTDTLMLLDVANVYANLTNFGDVNRAAAFLSRLPLDRLAYVHVGGGVLCDGMYHDTHAHPTPPEIIQLVEDVCARAQPIGIMLERDDNYPSQEELFAELDAIAAAMQRGRRRSRMAHAD